MASLARLVITGACNTIRFRPTSLNFQEHIRHAGHAKWQNIKNTKQANDLAKGKLISRYVMMVRRAIVSNGMQANPKLNSRLEQVLNEAYKLNVPKATLERAMVRAVNLKIISATLEIEGPSKSTLILKVETDNVQMLRRDVKKILKKYDSTLMPDDTLINMFRSQGFVRTATVTTDQRDITQDFAEEAAILSNAQDVYEEVCEDSKVWVFATDAASLNPCKGELEKLNFKVISHDLELVPYNEIDFGPEVYEKVSELTNALKELDQVVEVYNNVAIPKE